MVERAACHLQLHFPKPRMDPGTDRVTAHPNVYWTPAPTELPAHSVDQIRCGAAPDARTNSKIHWKHSAERNYKGEARQLRPVLACKPVSK
jgi:hypothetical protein